MALFDILTKYDDARKKEQSTFFRIFTMKLILQIITAAIGLIIKPQAALGKIYGICDYMSNQQHH